MIEIEKFTFLQFSLVIFFNLIGLYMAVWAPATKIPAHFPWWKAQVLHTAAHIHKNIHNFLHTPVCYRSTGVYSSTAAYSHLCLWEAVQRTRAFRLGEICWNLHCIIWSACVQEALMTYMIYFFPNPDTLIYDSVTTSSILLPLSLHK